MTATNSALHAFVGYLSPHIQRALLKKLLYIIFLSYISLSLKKLANFFVSFPFPGPSLPFWARLLEAWSTLTIG